MKSVYKKCLSSYEIFYRTLGVTMLNHTPSSRKDRGRSLIRDKDRTTPINPPALEKEDDTVSHEKRDDTRGKRSDKKRISQSIEISDRDFISLDSKSSARPKRDRIESKSSKDRKKGEKVKALIEKFEEQSKETEDEKVCYCTVMNNVIFPISRFRLLKSI